MDTILELIRDPVWQFVGAIVALVALVVTIIVSLRSRQRKGLSYGVLASQPLLTVDEALTGAIQVLYEGEEVQGVRLLMIQVINTGNVPIRQEDFDLPLAFSFGPQTRVLSYEVVESPPQGLRASLRRSGGDRGIVLNPLLLNPTDSVTLKFLLAQYDGGLKPTGRVVGVRRIREVPRSGAGGDGMRALVPFAVLLGTCTYLAWWISERLGYALEGTSFSVGITVAALTGFTWFLVSGWWSTATRPYRP